MPVPGSRFRPAEVCITCQQQKPCSYHGVRRGFVCSDCWQWRDVPPEIKLVTEQRNLDKLKRRSRKDFSTDKTAHPAHHYLTVSAPRNAPTGPPPSHPDAL